MSPIAVTAVYKFLPLRKEELPVLQKELTAFGKEHGMRGLTLLAEEGVNATVCGKPEVIEEWKTLLTKHFGEMVCKDSEAEELVFPRWFVKIRTEIVGLKKSEIRPDGRYQHLTPEEWDKMMEEEDIVVLDARNIYETDIGMFEGAVDPRLREFSDFPEYVKTCGISKDKKVLMYCTGGIRCEKALIEMEQQGYEHVYQLEGGILAYLKKFPHRKFKGECFIFDHRTALDQELKQSSRYRTCPHCGDPGDIEISCTRCDQKKTICAKCHEREERRTCSKDCRNRLLGMVPGTKATVS